MTQNDDIWHEISPPDVLDMFLVNIYHQNMFWDDFGKIDFFDRFCNFPIVGSNPKTAKNHEKPLKTVKNRENRFFIIRALPEKFLLRYLGLDRSESKFEFWWPILPKKGQKLYLPF